MSLLLCSLDPVVRTMREHGIDVNGENRSSLTFLHRAVALKKIESLGFYREDVNTQDAFGYTPLHYAVLMDNVDAVRDLLELGADPNVQEKTREGYSCMHLACKSGNTELVNTFLKVKGIKVDLQSSRHGTGLHLALRAQSLDIVKLLIEIAGVDVNAKDDKGQTALHLLALDMIPNEKANDSGHYLSALYDSGELNIEATDNKGRTPLHCAALTGNAFILEALTSLEANIEAVDKNGRTTLHYAICGIPIGIDSGMTSCLTILLSKGANVVAKSNDGLCPHDALQKLLNSRSWKKGEETALNVALLTLKKKSDDIIAAQKADLMAEQLLKEETTSRKKKKQGKKK